MSTDKPATDKCKEGGTCGIGGYCEDCHHRNITDTERLDWLSQADVWFDDPSDGEWTPETWRAAIDEKMKQSSPIH